MGTIRPEEISEDLAKKINDAMEEYDIPAILNAAIDAGLVVEAREVKVLRRALALLRTIRTAGYTPGGHGTIAIEARIKELESEATNE